MRNKRFSNRLLLETEMEYSKEERTAFLESLRLFSSFRNEVVSSGELKNAAEQIGQIVSAAEVFTMKETGEWFDKVTVSRDMKALKDSYKLFEKTCIEIIQLQQRLGACYDDIGNRLKRYYKEV